MKPFAKSMTGVALAIAALGAQTLVAAPVMSEKYMAGVDVVPSSTGEETKATVSGTVFEDRNRNGVFDEGEPGIQNVMVSNGFDVVLTDGNGAYSLPAASRGLTDFTVFVTKPRGFRTPTNDKNLPQFYYHHQPKGSPQMNFGGLPATGPQPDAINFPMIAYQANDTFRIAVSGDPQTYSNNEVGYMRDSLANEVAARRDLEFLVIEGDVVGDDLGLYPRYQEVLKATGIPTFTVPGNHDLDFDAPTDANSLDTYKRYWGPSYYSFEMGQVHFVMLDNMRYPCTPEIDNADGKHEFCNDPENAPTYNGIIDAAQQEWLANDLAKVPESKLIVLNMHIPLVSYVDQDSTKHQTDNTQWLYDLVEGRPVVALSGHTHTLENFRPGEYFAGWESALGLGATPFPQIITGATSGAWWSGDFDEYNLPMSIQRLGAPRGYLLFEFRGNEFVNRFKAANKPANEQMSIDFLSPTFLSWYQQMKDWLNTPASSRSETPPVNINDLPDTSILTHADLAGGTQLMMNVWNGSRDSRVLVQIDDRTPMQAVRTQMGNGDGKEITLDPFALKKQMYVFRFAAKSTSGNERAQGFEMFRGSKFGTSDPRPGNYMAEESNHIWAINVPEDLEDGVHTLKVKTKDVYGQEYSQHMTFEVMAQRPQPYFRKEAF